MTSTSTLTNKLASQFTPDSTSSARISSANFLDDEVGVIVPPRWSFSVGLHPNLCSAGSGGSSSGSVSYSSSDIPKWLHFNPKTITFSGITPSDTQDVQVPVTCLWDGTTATESFVIRVAHHLQALVSTIPPIITSPKNKVKYEMVPLLDNLRLDGRPLSGIQKGQVDVQLDQALDWLRYDPQLHRLEGTPPDVFVTNTERQTITKPLTFALLNSSPLRIPLDITILPFLFTQLEYPNISVTERFSFALRPFLREPDAKVELRLRPTDAFSWIALDNTTLVLKGTLPSGPLTYDSVYASFEALSTSSSLIGTSQLNILIPSQNPLVNQRSSQSPHYSRRETTVIVISSVVGAIGLFGLCYLAFWMESQRKKQRPAQSPVFMKRESSGAERKRGVQDETVVSPNMDRRASALSGDPVVGDSATRSNNPPMRWRFSKRVVTAGESGRKFARSTSYDGPSAGMDPRSISFPQSHRRASSYMPNGSHSPPSPPATSLPLSAPSMSRTDAQSGNDGHTAGTWGVEPPKPPPGLNPEQLQAWVDNLVCEWAASYRSEGSRQKPSHESSDIQPSFVGLGFGDTGPSVQYDGLPNQYRHGAPSAGRFDRSFLGGSPHSAAGSLVSFPSPSLSSTPQMLPPSRVITRSASRNTTTTFTNSSEVQVPSDLSSIASWDSLDSWEMERRYHYEEPRRRSDFAIPAGSSTLKVPIKTSSARPKRDRSPNPTINSAVYDVDPPSKLPKRRGEASAVPESRIGFVTSPSMGATLPSLRDPSTHGSDRATPGESPSDAHTEHATSLGMYDDQEDIVFFPRPAGAEPGNGLARSPHLETLSKFHNDTSRNTNPL